MSPKPKRTVWPLPRLTNGVNTMNRSRSIVSLANGYLRHLHRVPEFRESRGVPRRASGQDYALCPEGLRNSYCELLRDGRFHKALREARWKGSTGGCGRGSQRSREGRRLNRQVGTVLGEDDERDYRSYGDVRRLNSEGQWSIGIDCDVRDGEPSRGIGGDRISTNANDPNRPNANRRDE